MKPLTPEEEALLLNLQQRKEEYRVATVHCVNTIWADITDDEGNLRADKMVANAKRIRELLAPYDEAPVMLGEFVPASSNGVRVVDVTTLHGTRALNWLRRKDLPPCLAATPVATSRLKRSDPPNNVGYWYWTPDGYSVGPFETEAEREAVIREQYIEPPVAPEAPWGA